MNNYDLILIDPTACLVNRDGSLTFLPGAVDALSRIPSDAHVGLIVQAGGVGQRYWMESQGFGKPEKIQKLPTQKQAETRWQEVAEKVATILGYEFVPFYISFAFKSSKGNWSPIPPEAVNDPRWSYEWRMPNPSMVEHAISEFGGNPADTLIVSNWPYADEVAKNIGTQFQWAKDWLSPQKPPVTEWAIVEMLGHKTLAGRVSEETLFGQTLMRIDIPEGGEHGQDLTQWYGPSSIYCFTKCSEHVARQVAQTIDRPSWAYNLRPVEWQRQRYAPSYAAPCEHGASEPVPPPAPPEYSDREYDGYEGYEGEEAYEYS